MSKYKIFILILCLIVMSSFVGYAQYGDGIVYPLIRRDVSDGDKGDILVTGNGTVWSLDPNTGTGSGDITAVWSDDSGDVSALTATSGDTLNATNADSTIPWKVNNTAAPTTEGMAIWDADNDILTIGDGSGTDYAAYGASDGDALAGDSATSFFDAGTIEHERGGLEADINAYTGLIAISGGSTSEVDVLSELEAQIADVTAFVVEGTACNDLEGTGLSISTGTLNWAAVADSVTLTTHTVGNYVASITNGTGITGGDGGSEGAALTLAATLGTDIAASEMADGDHGFFSYASNVASLDTGGLTSADLSGALTNETGSGVAVFATSPTFTTSVLVANGSDLKLSTTTSGHEFSIPVYDNDDTTWRDVFTFSNGNSPGVTLGANTTLSGVGVINLTSIDNYQVGGTSLNDMDMGFTVSQSLDGGADLNDADVTSADKLEGVDLGVYIDLGGDGIVEVVSDGTVELTAPNIKLEVDADAYLNIATADGGATTVSQTSDGQDQIIIGDGSDSIVTKLAAGADAMADDNYSGIVISGLNAGEAITQWDTVFFNSADSEFHQADADASGEWPCRGIAVAAGTDGNPLIVLTQGIVRNDGWAWGTVGGTIYLADTAGGLTQTAPSTSGDCVQIVGWALSDDEMYVNISGHYLEVK